jgi:hypothetical protein
VEESIEEKGREETKRENEEKKEMDANTLTWFA